MWKLTRALALCTAAVALSGTMRVARADDGNNGNNGRQTVALRQQDCSSTMMGATLGYARFDVSGNSGRDGGRDGDRNGRGNSVEINVSLNAGMPNTSYRVFVLSDPCTVLKRDGTLRTDRRGRGEREVNLTGGTLQSGMTLRVQLVAPADAQVPGPGPFTDVLTSDPTQPLNRMRQRHEH